mmetsp:Transcript_66214/g.177310  ORF Transcript_66214/g.177310 Transcript_66214/m.177310 type:complete len:294 (-) Transcript_66214:546-1427(-)
MGWIGLGLLLGVGWGGGDWFRCPTSVALAASPPPPPGVLLLDSARGGPVGPAAPRVRRRGALPLPPPRPQGPAVRGANRAGRDPDLREPQRTHGGRPQRHLRAATRPGPDGLPRVPRHHGRRLHRLQRGGLGGGARGAPRTLHGAAAAYATQLPGQLVRGLVRGRAEPISASLARRPPAPRATGVRLLQLLPPWPHHQGPLRGLDARPHSRAGLGPVALPAPLRGGGSAATRGQGSGCGPGTPYLRPTVQPQGGAPAARDAGRPRARHHCLQRPYHGLRHALGRRAHRHPSRG